METKPIFLVDIDGTLADLTHRLHFIQCDKPDWDGFFAACPEDAPIPEVIETLRILRKGSDALLLMVSGRSDAIRQQTQHWFMNNSVPCDELYMRKAGDHRHDNIVKGELLDEIQQKYPTSPILGAFEDRQQVVDMYRARGIRVFQVADGKF